MKINSLRYLDRKIGIPLCNLLYYSKKIFFLHGRHQFEPDRVKKILVIKIWGMGSIIAASPVFLNLKDNFPEAEIWFLTKAGMENIYPRKFFDRIITIQLNGLFSEMFRFLRLVYEFRQQHFDLVIDLEIVSRYSAILAYICGAKTKVGFQIIGQNKDRLYDYNSVYHESKHITQIFLGTLESLGLNVKNYRPWAPEFSPADQAAVAEILKQKEINNGYVVINVNASELAYERRLPLNSFKTIIEDIKEKHPELAIILVGTSQERQYVAKFQQDFLSELAKVHNLAGEVSLSKFFVLLQQAKLVISNDSGPAHVAAALQTPLVVFFGPETPVIYRPLGERVSVFYANTCCGPCISVYKDKEIDCHYDQKCLKEIDLQKVKAVVEAYLKEQSDQSQSKPDNAANANNI